MFNQELKAQIKREWSQHSGKEIADLLRSYWCPNVKKTGEKIEISEEYYNQAQAIFNPSLT